MRRTGRCSRDALTVVITLVLVVSAMGAGVGLTVGSGAESADSGSEVVQRSVSDGGTAPLASTTSATTSLTLTWSGGYGTRGNGEYSPVPSARTDAELNFSNGTNYEVVVTNEDNGESVAGFVDGNLTVAPNDDFGIFLFDGSGAPRTDPSVDYRGEEAPFSVTEGSISDVTGSGLTNFSVALKVPSESTAFTETEPSPTLIGYSGSLSWNSTSGFVEFTVPRDNVPEGSTVELALRNRSTETEIRRTMSSAGDQFVTTIDVADYPSGAYGWFARFERDGDHLVTAYEFVFAKDDGFPLKGSGTTDDGSSDDGQTDSSLTLTPGDGYGMERDGLYTSSPAARTDTELTFSSGDNYEVVVTNEDTGESVVGYVDGSATVQQGEDFAVRLFTGTGEARSDPDLAYSGERAPFVVTEGQIADLDPSGVTNVSIALRDPSDSTVVTDTGPTPIVAGYDGTLSWNSTSGFVEFTIPRDVLPKDVSATLGIFDSEFNRITDTEMARSGDQYVTTVDLSETPAGTYSWNVQFTDGQTQYVSAYAFGSMEDQFSLAGSDTSVTLDPVESSFGDGDGYHSWHPAAFVEPGVTFDNGNNYQLRVTNEDTGESGTFAVDGTTDLSSDTPVDIGLYDADGSVSADPQFTLLGANERYPLRTVSGSVPPASGVTNLSVELIDVSSGAVVDSFTEPYLVGYRGDVSWDSTTGDVTFSLPKSDLPDHVDVSLRVANDDRSIERTREMTLDGSGQYTATLDVSDLPTDTYSVEGEFAFTDGETLDLDREATFGSSQTYGVSGTVQNAAGSVASGEVRLDGRLGHEGTLTDDATFELSGLQADRTYQAAYRQTSGAVDDVPDVFPIQRLHANGDQSLGTVELPSANHLDVEVVDANGDPVDGASVTLVLGDNRNFALAFGETDSTGMLTHFGTQGIDVAGPDSPQNDFGGNVQVQALGPNGERFAGKRLNVTSDQTVTLTLGSSTEVSGSVQDETGEPVTTGETLLVADSAGQSGGARATVGSSGTFTTTVPTETTYSLKYRQIGEEGIFPTDGVPDIYAARPVTVGTDSIEVPTVTLPKAHSLDLTVEDGSGDPVDDARVKIHHVQDTSSEEIPRVQELVGASTTSDGSVVLDATGESGVEVTGDIRVVVKPPADSTRFAKDRYVRRLTVDGDRDVSISLAEGTTTLTGSFETSEGDPLSGDLVLAGAEDDEIRTETDVDGAFSATIQTGSDYYVFGYFQHGQQDGTEYFGERDGVADIYAVSNLTPTGGTLDKGSMTVPDADVLRVQVVDSDGNPVENARVEVADEIDTGAYLYHWWETSADGQIYTGPNGEYRGVEVRGETIVRAEPPETTDGQEYIGTQQTVDVQDDRSVTVELLEAVTVTGTISESDGTPAAADDVGFFPDDKTKGETYYAETDETGTFEQNVPDSYAHDIQYYQNFGGEGPTFPRDGSPDMYALGEVDGSDVTVDETLPDAYGVNITVVDEAGESVPNASVTVQHINGDADAGRRTYTDGQGRWGMTEDRVGGELVGTVNVTVDPPTNASRFGEENVTDEFTVDAATSKTYTLETSGTSDPSVSLTANESVGQPGREATVEFNVTNNASKSGFILDVTALPDGFGVVDQTGDGATWKETDQKWLYQTVERDSSVTPTLTLSVPIDAQGSYTVEAELLDSESVVATTSTTVSTCRGLSAAVDENGDGRIGDFEVLTAIELWRTDEVVSGTCGERIGDFQVLTIIDVWRNDTPVSEADI